MLEDIKSKINKHRPDLMDIENKYGIAIPLIKREGSWELIYQVRSSSLRRQPGEICFPGGRLEEGETFKEGALRECREELCLEAKHIKVLGEIDRLVTSYGALVHSFPILIEGIDFEDIRPNPDEVAELFTVPLEFFLENKGEVYELELEVRENREFPYELIDGGKDYEWDLRRERLYFYKYRSRIIWGLTGRITKNFIDIVENGQEKNTFR